VGITVGDRNVLPVLNERWPSKYDIRNNSVVAGTVKPMIELWPTPDDAYPLKLFQHIFKISRHFLKKLTALR
jgi:hypothetical protein